MQRVGSRWFAFAAFAALSACGGTPASTSAATSSAAPAASASTTSGGANTANTPHETAVGDAPPEFPSADANRWVNGTPTTLASLHGNVVLVESWHRL